MTDPKDELGARFNERRVNADDSDDTDDSTNTDNTDDANHMSDASDTDDTSDTSDTNDTPDSDRDATAVRHRRQLPMYLPERKIESMNALYQRLDGRSKVAENGPIEKHADFMEAVVEVVLENEDTIADRLGIDDT